MFSSQRNRGTWCHQIISSQCIHLDSHLILAARWAAVILAGCIMAVRLTVTSLTRRSQYSNALVMNGSSREMRDILSTSTLTGAPLKLDGLYMSYWLCSHWVTLLVISQLFGEMSYMMFFMCLITHYRPLKSIPAAQRGIVHCCFKAKKLFSY